MSAQIINEQDKIILELREKMSSEEDPDLLYLDNFKNAATFLAWSSREILSTENTEESPSMDEINL